MSIEATNDEESATDFDTAGVYFVSTASTNTAEHQAIKIVDRNPKRKRLVGFSRNKGLAKHDGAKLVNENE